MSNERKRPAKSRRPAKDPGKGSLQIGLLLGGGGSSSGAAVGAGARRAFRVQFLEQPIRANDLAVQRAWYERVLLDQRLRALRDGHVVDFQRAPQGPLVVRLGFYQV